ncbi:MAG: hypothetical protein V1752_05400 [Candidatus Firestonebacteria bacterium]
MEKRAKNRLVGLFILLGIIPAVLLTVYFSFTPSEINVARKPNTPNVLRSEKNNAVSLTARNSWYLTMILRKIELAGRISGEVTAGVFKKQNAFFSQEDYKKIKTDASGKFLWSSGKEAGVLFVCGGYKTVSKDRKVPVIGAYLDNILSLMEKNGAVIESVYIMTESALRKYPWVKADDLVKTGLLKVGNYKIKTDALFSSEETSPYCIAGSDSNKSKMEIWTEAYWSPELKSWMISYLMPLYVDGVYKGVLGADISLQKLLEKLIGKDQSKKFTYADTFPVVLTKDGVLVASSIYGYDMLKIDGFETKQSDLKSFGEEGFKSSLSRVLDPGFWDNATRDEDLGGIENVSVNKKDYYLAHFPVRTGGLTFALFIPAVSLEKSAAVSVVSAGPKSGRINYRALSIGFLGIGLSVILMFILAGCVSKNTGFSDEEGAHKLSEEKRSFDDKLRELGERNTALANQLEKTRTELKDKDAFVSGDRGAEPDFSKYVPVSEFNAKLEAEKKGFLLKLSELEKTKADLENRLKDANLDKVKLEEKLAESAKNFSLKSGNDQGMGQRLSAVQKANDVFKENFEKLKKENEELVNKVKSLENEGRKLAELLVSKFEEEKKNYRQKVEELNKQVNIGASKVLELENKIKADSVKLAEMDPSKFVPLVEVNTRIEADRKNFVLRIQELENRPKTALEKPEPSRFTVLDKVKEENELKNRQREQVELNAKLQQAEKQIRELEIAVKALNQEKTGLAAQLAEVASSKDAAQKVVAAVGEAARKMEEDRMKAAAKVRELEKVKLDLEQKYMLLTNENKKMREALNVVEGRKKETDKQAQSLILKVGEDQQALKEQIKELLEQNGKLAAERDAARKHYEIMRKELEQEQSKSLPVAPVENNSNSAEKSVLAASAASSEHSEEEENNLLVVDDQGEIIKIFGDSLYNMNYSVYIARNLRLAKQKLTMGNYRNVILNVNLADGDYKEFFELVKKGDPKLAEKIVFYNNDDLKDKDFLLDKKIIREGISEPDIKKLMT